MSRATTGAKSVFDTSGQRSAFSGQQIRFLFPAVGREVWAMGGLVGDVDEAEEEEDGEEVEHPVLAASAA